ncbi:MAG: Hsp20/alpha crystallin family protein [Chloroflexi bacterium]|nr:MAG: Hsp20/alpha crystallin family protein [Chloroflexota bacterium]
MTIARFTPLDDVVSLREAMDRLFEDSFIRPTTWTGLAAGQVAVPVDLWETKDAYHLRADLPGLSPDDIEINATGDTLTISGETKPSNDLTDEGWLRQERRSGKFTRSFTIPMQIDPTKVEAKFQNGVLELVLPKAENVKPRSIKINATAK